MENVFDLCSEYQPTGDQPKAISEIVKGFKNGVNQQTLLGVTGSGKTFTMANVIQNLNKPTLILSHNKTLAAQLYSEFKEFFPNNLVEYFVSYYDYYQPEAYLPVTNTYIEKDLSINKEIEKLRLSATSSLISGRTDVIIVSSVSCIYGMGNPEDFAANMIDLGEGKVIERNHFLRLLVGSQYERTDMEFNQGKFRVKGDTVDVFPAYLDYAIRISFWGDEIESIEKIDPETGKSEGHLRTFKLYPANLFVTSSHRLQDAIKNIQDDLMKQVDFFNREGKVMEAKRLLDRVEYDLEMIRELGYCSGIENYSRYFDGRKPGARPFCLLDYFPQDFLLFIDESHVTIPQIKAMYGGDKSRKINLVEYGFRLPAAMDNRPLKFEEFDGLVKKVLYVSATPADYELEKSEGVIVEQVIRPTGLLDPIIEIKPVHNQVDDLLEEIDETVKKGDRVLVTTLTKRMAEELSKYLDRLKISAAYIHSDVDTIDRIDIIQKLKQGHFDVLIGVNLLREGLDLPEVSLVAILDADKEGFLRSERSLTQTVGRAARNLNGRVIMYADKITESMHKTIDETNRRRTLQEKYNQDNNIQPQALRKNKKSAFNVYGTIPEETPAIAADPVIQFMSKDQILKNIEMVKEQMQKAAKELDFASATKFRDEMFALEKILEKK
jgi:excinuclease ABC subunit B